MSFRISSETARLSWQTRYCLSAVSLRSTVRVNIRTLEKSATTGLSRSRNAIIKPGIQLRQNCDRHLHGPTLVSGSTVTTFYTRETCRMLDGGLGNNKETPCKTCLHGVLSSPISGPSGSVPAIRSASDYKNHTDNRTRMQHQPSIRKTYSTQSWTSARCVLESINPFGLMFSHSQPSKFSKSRMVVLPQVLSPFASVHQRAAVRIFSTCPRGNFLRRAIGKNSCS